MFHCSVGTQSYADIYRECTGYTVIESSELPNRICNNCENKLISFHSFRLSIEKIEERLEFYQEHITDLHIEDHETPKVYEFKLTSENEDLVLERDSDADQFIVEQVFEEDEMLLEDDSNRDLEEDMHQNFEEEETLEKPQKNGDLNITCRFIQSPSNLRQVRCVICTGECQNEIKLNKLKANGQFFIPCECSSNFKSRQSFLKHYTTSTIHNRNENAFSCKHCDEKFPSWRTRFSHEASIHNIGFKFECQKCKKKFYRSDHCKKHEKICNRINNQIKYFSCDVCLTGFQREETYLKHLQTAHPGASENDEQFIKKAKEYKLRYSKTRNDLPDNTSDKDGPICRICNKIFKNDLSLQKHTSLFHTEQVWSCDKCDAVFVHHSTKMSHMYMIHGVKKPFECSYPNCSMSFVKKDRYNAHVEKHENPDKKFSCPICQQEFSSYNTMTLHRAKHLANNIYVCPTCSKQFLDRRNYFVHMKLHNAEDLHHCPTCERGFNRKEHLQKHQERKDHYYETKVSNSSMPQE